MKQPVGITRERHQRSVGGDRIMLTKSKIQPNTGDGRRGGRIFSKNRFNRRM